MVTTLVSKLRRAGPSGEFVADFFCEFLFPTVVFLSGLFFGFSLVGAVGMLAFKVLSMLHGFLWPEG